MRRAGRALARADRYGRRAIISIPCEDPGLEPISKCQYARQEGVYTGRASRSSASARACANLGAVFSGEVGRAAAA